MKLLAPAYGYPGTERALWDGLAAASAHVGHVIVNPASGPGRLRDPNWVDQVRRLEALGVPLLGYLNLDYSAKPLDRLIQEVSVWRRWYGVVEFFLDCAPSRDIAHTSNVADLLRTTGRATHLVANPGTRTAPEIALHFDAIVEREGPPAPLWDESDTSGESAAERMWIVHSADSAGARTTLASAARQGVEEIWLTDLSGTNPYRGLPSYWTWLLRELGA